MERNIFEKQRELNDRLNRYRDEYYNRNAPSVSDEVYDRLFDELKELEQETGIQMANSPTQTVGYPAVSRLEKTRHEIPLLSLDKTKSSMDLLNFMGEQQVMLMLKLDGLTVKLTYENGELLEAATRGDGDEGEIITHNTRAISGIPSHITYKERLVVTGEGFIRPSDFEELKTSLQDSSGKPYKNGRNLAAGSIRLMDAKTCQERRLVFMPFGVLEGFPHLTRKSDKLRELRALGFQPCKYLVTKQKLTLENVEAGIYQLRQYATDKDIPIDGIVVSFNDIAYAQSCGRTGHHYKDGLAYKFEDDLHESLLQYIEWTPGRTGEIAPVAVFTPVEIDGCEVSRASLHNLSFIEDLELMAGNRILVSKRNMIIPHVEENLDRGGFSMVDTIPHVCPCCGQPTRIHESSGKGENGENRIIKTLYCDNPDCETRRLKKFVHFVSQKAMDIEGLSEATLEKFIGQGFIHSYMKKILLIDDSDTYIWNLRKYLQRRGYPVKTASTLNEARAAIQEEMPLVVCCDLDLPDGSGMDFLDEVRAADKELPFVLASCHDKDDYEQEAMRRGATLCMDKMKGLLLQDKLVEYAYRQLSGEKAPTFHKLLFVYAEDTSAEVLRAAMLQKGFDLILVSSIWEAKRRIFEDKEIELILCDLKLPDGTAMELFHTLRRVAGMFQMKNPPVRLLPFFILTENNDPATEYEYRHEGVNDYITAPVNIPELIRRVLFFVE